MHGQVLVAEGEWGVEAAQRVKPTITVLNAPLGFNLDLRYAQVVVLHVVRVAAHVHRIAHVLEGWVITHVTLVRDHMLRIRQRTPRLQIQILLPECLFLKLSAF